MLISLDWKKISIYDILKKEWIDIKKIEKWENKWIYLKNPIKVPTNNWEWEVKRI